MSRRSGYAQNPRLAYLAYKKVAEEYRAAGELALSQRAEGQAEDLLTLYDWGRQ